MKIGDILDSASALLSGEPARIIGYGAAVVVYIVARLTVLPDLTPEQSLALAGSELVTVGSIVESIRHYVSSPATVARIRAGATPGVTVTATPLPQGSES